MLDATAGIFWEGEHTVEEMAETATALEVVLQEVKATYESFLASVKVKMLLDGIEDLPTPDGREVHVSFPTGRKAWRHAEIADVVSRRIVQSATDQETGEVTLTREDMVKELLKYASVSGWKVTTCSEIGVNVDNYCEANDGSTISIRKAK